MALAGSFTGRPPPPTAVYEVGREKIREFADAIGDPNPLYRDPVAAREHGHPDVLAPPTFPFMIAWPAVKQIIDDPEIGVDFSRVLHADQRFVFPPPIYARDRLAPTGAIEAVT